MLKSMSLHNFKSARNLTIPLCPLTVLSGLNGSGKSTVLQAMGLLLQNLTSDAPVASASSLHLNGYLVHLGTIGDILSDRPDEKPIKIALTGQGHAKPMTWKSKGTLMLEDDILQVSISGSGGQEIQTSLKKNGFQFLQADRLTPQTLYEKSDSWQRQIGFLGAHGEYTPDFLARRGDQLTVPTKRQLSSAVSGIPPDLMARIDATPKLYAQITRWLQFLSPGVKLDAEPISETDSVKLAFSYASTETAQDSSNRRPLHVGFGLTYCLPILTACLAAKPGALLLLENPEAHLHPRGQTAMGLLLAKCAADGVQILVETHSDHILNGIRLAVKQKASGISAGDVQICHFTRNPISGDSYIEEPMILPNGELSSWPEGFFDEWEKSLESLLG